MIIKEVYVFESYVFIWFVWIYGCNRKCFNIVYFWFVKNYMKKRKMVESWKIFNCNRWGKVVIYIFYLIFVFVFKYE